LLSDSPPPCRCGARPDTRRYWFGFLLNELPFVVFYWLAASTALALSEGAAHDWPGRIALGLAAATTVGLALVAWGGLQARRAVEAALAAALGPRRRAALDGNLAARLRRRRPLARILITPFPVRRRDVERVSNISYGEAGRWNLLDLYRHRSTSRCPTLVYLHGGGFRSGRKSKEARAALSARKPRLGSATEKRRSASSSASRQTRLPGSASPCRPSHGRGR
jgi:hypothetical protein